MTKVTKETKQNPVATELDSEVLQFRSQFEGQSPLDEIIHDGLRGRKRFDKHRFLIQHRIRHLVQVQFGDNDEVRKATVAS